MVPEITCYKCGKNKPLTEFSDCKSKGGRASRHFKHTYCKKCQSEYVVIRRKLKRAEQKAEIVDHYGGKCCKCGFADHRALVIDHVNDDGGEERRNGLGHPNDFYRHVILMGFPDKYQLLCANCNTIKEFERVRNG